MATLESEYAQTGSSWRGQLGSQLLAVGCALGVTFMLFAVVPLLLHPERSPEPAADPARPVTVVSVARPKAPVRPPAQQVAVAASKPLKRLPAPQSLQPQLKKQFELPFELTPQLPDLPDITIPQIEAEAVAASDFALPDVFASGDLDQPLVPLVRQQPLYPLFAKQRRVQGQVRVRFVVTTTGTVEQITIIDAIPAEVFDESVTRCVRGWRFRPGTVNGVAVASWAETTISFVLK